MQSLYDLGVDGAVVADSHGPMVNIIPDKLPDHTQLVRGSPRAFSMVAGAEGCDAAFFVGYHAKPGTQHGVLDHVMNSRVFQRVKLNGEDCSEFLFNGAYLGELGIPVVLVAGDKALLEEDVKKFAPWAVRASLKEGLGRYSAISPSMNQVATTLKEACKDAMEVFNRKQAKLIRFEPPVNLEIAFTSTAYADIANHLPHSKRVDGTTVSFEASTVSEAYMVMQLLMMAAQGVRAQVDG